LQTAAKPLQIAIFGDETLQAITYAGTENENQHRAKNELRRQVPE